MFLCEVVFIVLFNVLQMDDIHLPMKRGSMDDISQENDSSQTDENTSDSTARDSTSGSRAIYEKEARIQIDYSMLDEEEKEVRNVYIDDGHLGCNFVMWFCFCHMVLLL